MVTHEYSKAGSGPEFTIDVGDDSYDEEEEDDYLTGTSSSLPIESSRIERNSPYTRNKRTKLCLSAMACLVVVVLMSSLVAYVTKTKKNDEGGAVAPLSSLGQGNDNSTNSKTAGNDITYGAPKDMTDDLAVYNKNSHNKSDSTPADWKASGSPYTTTGPSQPQQGAKSKGDKKEDSSGPYGKHVVDDFGFMMDDMANMEDLSPKGDKSVTSGLSNPSDTNHNNAATHGEGFSGTDGNHSDVISGNGKDSNIQKKKPMNVLNAEEAEYLNGEGKGEDFLSSQKTNLLPAWMEENLADVDRQDSSTDTPMYWKIPGSDIGSVVETVIGSCLGLVQASSFDSPGKDLSTVVLDGSRFVDVDLFTLEGVENAKKLGLAESGVADVIVSPYFYQGSQLFDRDHRGQLFALLMHPVQATAVMYVVMMEDDELVAQMSLEEFAKSHFVIDNYMTRSLTNNINDVVTKDHLNAAKEILWKKTVIGMADKIDEAIHRFEKYFSWTAKSTSGLVYSKVDTHDCHKEILASNKIIDQFPTVAVGSQAWNLLLEKNMLDLELFEYARKVYDDQLIFFEH